MGFLCKDYSEDVVRTGIIPPGCAALRWVLFTAFTESLILAQDERWRRA
jgi:hypothetical protein